MGWFSRSEPAPPPVALPSLPGADAASFADLRRRVDGLEDDLAELHKRYRRLLGSVTKSEALARAAEDAGPAGGPATAPGRRPAGLSGALTPAARAQLMGG
jgi:hypothetical protein